MRVNPGDPIRAHATNRQANAHRQSMTLRGGSNRNLGPSGFFIAPDQSQIPFVLVKLTGSAPGGGWYFGLLMQRPKFSSGSGSGSGSGASLPNPNMSLAESAFGTESSAGTGSGSGDNHVYLVNPGEIGSSDHFLSPASTPNLFVGLYLGITSDKKKYYAIIDNQWDYCGTTNGSGS